MQAQAQPAADAFTACLRLFRRHPLAVRRHYAEHRYGSMVLMNRETGQQRYFVLIMEWDDCFVIRPWDRRDGTFRRTEINVRPAGKRLEAALAVTASGYDPGPRRIDLVVRGGTQYRDAVLAK